MSVQTKNMSKTQRGTLSSNSRICNWAVNSVTAAIGFSAEQQKFVIVVKLAKASITEHNIFFMCTEKNNQIAFGYYLLQHFSYELQMFWDIPMPDRTNPDSISSSSIPDNLTRRFSPGLACATLSSSRYIASTFTLACNNSKYKLLTRCN